MLGLRFTELPKLEPSPRAAAIVEALYPRRPDAPGSIDKFHAEFLLTVIESCNARKVVEIGVASGASSLYMLGMLKELSGRRQLFALDSEATYYADASKVVGFLALESEFNDSNRLVLKGNANSTDIRTTIEKYSADPDAPVDVAFVDGNHRHPWPTLDLLFLLPLMREGGVVVFHDINLPVLTGAAKGFGPTKLFECPFESKFVEPGDRPNIGGVRISDKAGMIDLTIAALAKEWEVSFGEFREKQIMSEIRNGPLASRAADIAPYFHDL